ncbi:hypothetical protein D3C87_1516560 [compost metagenome]
MFQDDAEGRGPHELHRRDEIGIAEGHGFGARDARIGRPRGNRDGKHGVFDARPKCGDQRQRQNQLWKGQKDIGDAHQNRIHPAAGITRDGADDEPDGRRDDGHQQHHEQGQPRTVDEARENIAPLIVGAEQVSRRTGRQKPGIAQIALHRIMRRQHIGKQRDEQQRNNDAEAEQRQPVFRKPPPDDISTAKTRLLARGRPVGEQPFAAIGFECVGRNRHRLRVLGSSVR